MASQPKKFDFDIMIKLINDAFAQKDLTAWLGHRLKDQPDFAFLFLNAMRSAVAWDEEYYPVGPERDLLLQKGMITLLIAAEVRYGYLPLFKDEEFQGILEFYEEREFESEEYTFISAAQSWSAKLVFALRYFIEPMMRLQSFYCLALFATMATMVFELAPEMPEDDSLVNFYVN